MANLNIGGNITREMLDLSDKIKPKVTDDSVVYKLLTNRRFYALSQHTEQIYDEGDGKVKMIGAFKNRLNFELEMLNFTYGKLVVSPKSNIDIFNYMELSNYNASNPRRDKSIPPIWERIDEVKEKKARQVNTKNKMKVYAYLGGKPNAALLKSFLLSNSMASEGIGVEDLVEMVSNFLDKNPNTIEDFAKLLKPSKEEDTPPDSNSIIGSGKGEE